MLMYGVIVLGGGSPKEPLHEVLCFSRQDQHRSWSAPQACRSCTRAELSCCTDRTSGQLNSEHPEIFQIRGAGPTLKVVMSMVWVMISVVNIVIIIIISSSNSNSNSRRSSSKPSHHLHHRHHHYQPQIRSAVP